MKNQTINTFKYQHGAVLVMSLLMLFVLTLIGVSSISTTTMEEKMSGNARNRHIALQSAETAIKIAEKFITDSVNNPVGQFANSGGLYSLGQGPSSKNAIDYSWWYTTGYAKTTNARVEPSVSNSDLKYNPEYTIEYIGETTQVEATDIEISSEPGGSQGGIHTFRITARGTGITKNSVVVIQSHFGKRI